MKPFPSRQGAGTSDLQYDAIKPTNSQQLASFGCEMGSGRRPFG
jgi:hypothetical protein